MEPLVKGFGVGFPAGLFAGLVAHYFAGGKLTFGIYLIVGGLSLASLKGIARVIGLIAFVLGAIVSVNLFKLIGR
jgi:hypothetical protein